MAREITSKLFLANVTTIAMNMAEDGYTVSIDHKHCIASVDHPDRTGIAWQGEEFGQVLDSVPDNVNEFDWLLYEAWQAID